MTHTMKDGGQVLQVGMLARVEGEGGMHIEIRDGVVETVQLNIFEPPRFYEAFLRGRAHTEPPDITARICGICPVAYQTAACWAIEDVCGVEVPAHLHAMRRLLHVPKRQIHRLGRGRACQQEGNETRRCEKSGLHRCAPCCPRFHARNAPIDADSSAGSA